MIGVILAHGVGGRGDLPIPFWLFSYQAIMALVGSVIVLAFFWRSAKLAGIRGIEVVAPNSWVNISVSIIGWLIRLASLALFLVVLFATLFGDLRAAATIAPVTIFIIFWVGLVMLSGLLGDVWQLLSPWNTLALIFSKIRRLLKGNSSASSRSGTAVNLASIFPAPSPRTNSWVAVLVLFIFVWMELVHPDPSGTRLLGLMIFFYSLWLLLGASLWSREWLKTADAFAILHRLIGSLGIFQLTRKNGRPNKSGELLPPLTGTAKLNLGLAETAFVLVFLGTTTFDGITNTDWWGGMQDSTGWSAVPLNTLGMIGTVLALSAAYFLAMAVAGRLTRENPIKLATSFAHSLIPIALAYSIAHYFSLLILEGQDFIPLLSDPLNQGWNLFGTAHISINFQLVSTRTIAWVQALSLLGGHLWGVFLAHDRALEKWSSNYRLANRSQYPLVAVMVGYTVLGLFLLLNA